VATKKIYKKETSDDKNEDILSTWHSRHTLKKRRPDANVEEPMESGGFRHLRMFSHDVI